MKEAQGKVERLGDNAQPPIVDQPLERWTVRRAAGAGGVNGLEYVDLLGTRIEANAGGAALVAYRQANYICRLLCAVGIAQVAGQIDGVVQRDHCGAVQVFGKKGSGEVEIGDCREGVRAVKRGIAADLGRGHQVLLAVQRPDKLRLRAHRAAAHLAGNKLFHIAESGGPCDQRTHRSAVTLYLRLGTDHVAGVEAKSFHHVEAIGGVVEGEGVGRQQKSRCGRLVKRLVQLRGQSRLVGIQRERQPELGRGLWQHHVQRLAGGVFEAFEDPVNDLRAAIGEDDADALILNGRLGL